MLDYTMTWSGAPGAVGYNRDDVSVSGLCAARDDNMPPCAGGADNAQGGSVCRWWLSWSWIPPFTPERYGFPSYWNKACLTRREKIGGIQCEG